MLFYESSIKAFLKFAEEKSSCKTLLRKQVFPMLGKPSLAYSGFCGTFIPQMKLTSSQVKPSLLISWKSSSGIAFFLLLFFLGIVLVRDQINMDLHLNKYKIILIKQRQVKMTNLAHRRLQNELKDFTENPDPRFRFQVNESDIMHWTCYIQVDNSAPCYGRDFAVNIEFPSEYPKKPPIFRVQSPKEFYHPNIDFDSGYICSASLNKKEVAQSLRARIEAFLQLLANPNPGDPLNDQAAKLFDEDERKYYRKARMIFLGRERQQNTRSNIYTINEKKEQNMPEVHIKVEKKG